MGRTKAEEERMILSNLGLVHHIAWRIRKELPFDDKVQEGVLGLIHAISRFDESKGVRFGTYASWWVRQSIERMARRYQRGPNHPVQVDLALRKMKKVRRRLWGILKRPPTLKEIAQAAGLPIKKARLFDNLTKPLTDIRDTSPFLMQSARPPWGATETLPEHDAAKEELRVLAADLVRSLKPKERFVVTRRLGLDGGEGSTLSQIAGEMGLSRERIRQIWVVAIGWLKRNARGEGFEVYL